MPPTLTCPQCGSSNIVTYDFAKKICGAVGAFLGTVLSLSAAIAMSRRSPIPTPSHPVVLTGQAGEFLRLVVFGAATGYTAGLKLGQAIDENLIENFECMTCGCTFSKTDPDHIGI